MKIAGVSAFYYEAAAALLDDGPTVFAAAGERFTRVKHASRSEPNSGSGGPQA